MYFRCYRDKWTCENYGGVSGSQGKGEEAKSDFRKRGSVRDKVHKRSNSRGKADRQGRDRNNRPATADNMLVS